MGLLQAIPGRGSHVFEHTAVEEVEEKPLAVKAGNYKIHCRYVILATHTPLTGKTGTMSALLFQTKLFLYTSYAIFGGQDHKTGQVVDTTSAYKRLEETLPKIFPQAQVDHWWSGQVIETPDGLPYIGETASRQFAATGFGGNGMTFGTLGAMMAIDAVLKRKNPWSQLFAPDRKKLKAAWDYLKENKDYPYYMVRDRLGRAEGNSLRALKRNEGKILRLDGRKVAAFRDVQGRISLCSPVCTHLKCIVVWNKAEKTWDCPCHGSRFKATGEVIAGPAEEDLEKLPLPEEK